MTQVLRCPYRLSRCESFITGIRWLGKLPGRLAAQGFRRSEMFMDESNVQADDGSAPLERTTRLHLGSYRPLALPERKLWFNRRLAQLVTVLVAAVALKYFYSTASVNELRWILAPTTRLVEIISGQQFHFESYAGYVNREHTVVIAGSCAGVNFLLTAFLMLALRRLWRSRGQILKWRYLGLVGIVAYGTTIIANTFRITTALRMLSLRIESSWFNANELHRLEGIFVYFGFLLLLYLLAEMVSDRKSLPAMFSFRRLGFPLVIYYGTTLGLPFVNGAFRDADFWRHAVFVLLTPLVVLVPLAVASVLAKRSRAVRFS